MPERESTEVSEVELSKPRNEVIRNLVAEGKIPMLEFEQRELEIKLLGHTVTQEELGKLLAEAMSTSSETWHDNAPADAVTEQSRVLVERAKGVAKSLKDRYVIEYPQMDHKVSIGSLVNVTIGSVQSKLFLTGCHTTLPEDIASIVGEDTTAVSIQSPVGTAIFDQLEEMTVPYSVGNRKLQVTIDSIENLDLSSITE